MKKVLAFLFLAVFAAGQARAQLLGNFGPSSGSGMPEYEKEVSVGPLDIGLRWCADVEKLAAFLTAFQSVNFPVSGVPGIAFGSVMENNAILDMCQFFANLAQKEGIDRIFYAADYGNKLMGGKMDDELNLARQTFDLYDVFYDENGKARPGAQIYTAQSARRMDRWLKTTMEYSDDNYGTNFNPRTRQQLESDMARLNRLSYQRALNKETMSCPAPPVDEDYQKIYDKEVEPQMYAIEILEEKLDFYREALLSMSVKISNNEEENEEFVKELGQLEQESFDYNIAVRSKTVKTIKRKKRQLGPNPDPTEARTQEYEAEIDKKYQTFCGAKQDVNNLSGGCPLKSNPALLRDFVKKWGEKWSTWVTTAVMKSSRGLLNGPRERVEEEFVDFSVLCNRGEIRERIPRGSPDYNRRLEEEYQKCVQQTSRKISQSKNLLALYAKEMVETRKELMQRRGHVWTFESYHLGYFRTISRESMEDANGVYTQEQVQCSPIRNLAVLQQKQAQNAAINAELNQMLVEQMFKQNAMMAAQEEKRKKQQEEERRRRELEIERKRRQETDYSRYVKFPELKESF